MAVKDVVLTLKGDQAAVSKLEIYPAPDGTAAVIVSGFTKEAGGKTVNMEQASLKVRITDIAAVENMLARALMELRKANGLE